MALGNTATRVIVSLIAIPFILISCYFGGLLFLALILGIGLTAWYEFDAMAKNKNSSALTVTGFIAVALIICDAYFRFAELRILIYFIIIALFIVELFRNRGSAIYNLGATLIGILYIGLFAGTIVEIREFFAESPDSYNQGGFLIISVLASIWVCDSAAFFVGSAIGKHKMFPRVSPKKSWEGAIAGFLFSIAAMIAAKYIILDVLSLTDAVIIGVIVGTIGQIGDLVESLLKRDAGVKDSSNLIPGHGGIFDRFDSLLLTSPAVYLFLYYFVK